LTRGDAFLFREAGWRCWKSRIAAMLAAAGVGRLNSMQSELGRRIVDADSGGRHDATCDRARYGSAAAHSCLLPWSANAGLFVFETGWFACFAIRSEGCLIAPLH